jgi:hypothetical protein
MWALEQITITLEEIDTHDPPVALVRITTPVGTFEFWRLSFSMEPRSI